MALNNHGYNRVLTGDVDAVTEELLAESLRLRRQLDEKRGVVVTLSSLAELQLLREELGAAATTLEETLTLANALTHAELTCITLNLQGFLHLARGDATQAAHVFRDSIRRSQPHGFLPLVAEALLGLAEVAALQGAITRALRFAVVATQVITWPNAPHSFTSKRSTAHSGRRNKPSISQPGRQYEKSPRPLPSTRSWPRQHGPVPHITEQFALTEHDGGTRLEYSGELGTDFGVAGQWSAAGSRQLGRQPSGPPSAASRPRRSAASDPGPPIPDTPASAWKRDNPGPKAAACRPSGPANQRSRAYRGFMDTAPGPAEWFAWWSWPWRVASAGTSSSLLLLRKHSVSRFFPVGSSRIVLT